MDYADCVDGDDALAAREMEARLRTASLPAAPPGTSGRGGNNALDIFTLGSEQQQNPS